MTTTIKLTGRTGAQIDAAGKYLADVAETGKTTITFTVAGGLAFEALTKAIHTAQAEGRKGDSIALHSIQRAFDKAVTSAQAEAGAAVSDEEAKAAKAASRRKLAEARAEAKAAKGRRSRAAKADEAVAAELVGNEAAATAVKATGPRGELLDRKGTLIEDGALAGYLVVLPFREFETLKVNQGTRSEVAADQRWAVRCVAHGTHTFAANGTEAEKAGARKARQGWCKGCAKEAAAK